MRNARVFKWVAVLLVITVFYGTWKALTSSIEQTVYKVEKVNSQVTLFITEGSAGATTDFVYQYYLVPSAVTESEFLKYRGDKYKIFLSTSDGNATLNMKERAIHLTVKGNIYSFNNGASYSTRIYLNASPL